MLPRPAPGSVRCPEPVLALEALGLALEVREDGGVVPLGLEEEVGALAIGSDVDGVPARLEYGCQLAGQPFLVLDDEQAHGRPTLPAEF